MVLSLFVGCGKKEDVVQGDGKLTVGIPQKSSITDYDNNAFTKYIEETAGVEIEFVYFSSSATDYKQQLTLMAGGGDKLPDVIVGFGGMGYDNVNQLGEDGFLIDLTDLIEEYGVNYKNALKELTDEKREYVLEKAKNTNDGKIYAMPTVECEAIDQLRSLIYINQNWLNVLGLPIPSTTEELYTTLQAFATKDPNGNGVKDEIPMLGEEGIHSYLINAFVAYDGANFNVTKGKVWDPIKTDEYRQALTYANKLVKEGLYSDLSFTIASNDEYKTLISPVDGPSKVGIFAGHYEYKTDATTNALDEFVALPALADATGKGGYTMSKETNVTWSAFITKDCDDTVSAMKFLDLFYTDETMSRGRHGEKDVDWTYAEGKNAYGTDSYVNIVNGNAFFSGNSTWGTTVLGIMTQKNYLAVAEEGEGRVAQTSRVSKELWTIKTEGKMPEEQVVDLIYTTEENLIKAEKDAKVNSFIGEQNELFMSGEHDVNDDNAWTEFLNTLETLGRSELMKVAQDAFSRK